MKIEQMYTACLAQGAYYIQSQNEAAIIDPLREIDVYLEKARLQRAKIKYIFETHFHADFISGHVTLSKKTGAPIIFGPTAKANFNMQVARDGELFRIGEISIKVLHTPGHTMESCCYLLIDEQGKERALFSGDTLFLGDVGRPDLAQKNLHKTKEEMAGLLYDNLREKIMPLSDELIVYPGHGEGSACGKNMMSERMDTLGNQKKVNYALQLNLEKREFIRDIVQGLTPPPEYFPSAVKMNQEGYTSTDKVLEKGSNPLNPEKFEMAIREHHAIILDVRKPRDFTAAHIPNSIFIGLDGGFAPWAGELLGDVMQTLVLVTPKGREAEAITRLARVGFDNILGYLDGGIETWRAEGKKIGKVTNISSEQLAKKYAEDKTMIFDVRKESEYETSHIEGARNIPLSRIWDRIAEFSNENTFYIHCMSGYRSTIASSILLSKGIQNFANVEDGFKGILKTDMIKVHEDTTP